MCRAEEERLRAEAMHAKNKACMQFVEEANKAAQEAMQAETSAKEALRVNDIAKASESASVAAACSKLAGSAALSCLSSGDGREDAKPFILQADHAAAVAKEAANDAAQAITKGKAKAQAQAYRRASSMRQAMREANSACDKALETRDAAIAAAKLGKVDQADFYRSRTEWYASKAAEAAAKISAASEEIVFITSQAGNADDDLMANVQEAVAMSVTAYNLSNQAVLAAEDAVGWASTVASLTKKELTEALDTERWGASHSKYASTCTLNGKNPFRSVKSMECLLPPLPYARGRKRVDRKSDQLSSISAVSLPALFMTTRRQLERANPLSPRRMVPSKGLPDLNNTVKGLPDLTSANRQVL